jgi:hypothetical protein
MLNSGTFIMCTNSKFTKQVKQVSNIRNLIKVCLWSLSPKWTEIFATFLDSDATYK